MVRIPPDLAKILAVDEFTMTRWEKLTPIARRDFISWIVSAKQAATRKRRVESVPSRLASGRRRPCCYAVVPMELYRALGENADAKSKWKELRADEKRDFNDMVAAVDDKVARARVVMRVVAAIVSGRKRL